MIRMFREKDFNVCLCDVSEDALKEAKDNLDLIKGKGNVLSYKVDITKSDEVSKMIKDILKKNESIDIWINNAGVNQPNKPIWDVDFETIDRLIDIDIKGSIICSKLVMEVMNKQGSGQIYNVEGHGSNDAKILGLSLYGTSKRAITYFTEALAYEVKQTNSPVLVGKITPGIMITNFITTSLGDGEKIELDEKTKNVYNILGDYPETIAEYMVDRIINNKKNNVKFAWLTNRRAAMRFMTSSFKRRDFFQ